MNYWALLLAGGFTAVATGVAAQEINTGEAENSSVAKYEELLACREIDAVLERVECYDNRVDAFSQAEKAGDILIVQKTEVEEARRGLFGLKLPQLNLFGDRSERPEFEAIDKLETSLASAKRIGRDKWQIRLEGGALWEQIDSRSLYRAPMTGDVVIIKRRSLGSYLVKIGNNTSIRMKRVE